MPCTQPSVSERIMNSSRRQICGQSSKKRSRKNSTISKIVHINAKTKTATPLINTGAMAVFGFIKCQRWDFIIFSSKSQYSYECPFIAREFYTSFFSVLIQILYLSHLRLIFLSNFYFYYIVIFSDIQYNSDRGDYCAYNNIKIKKF